MFHGILIYYSYSELATTPFEPDSITLVNLRTPVLARFLSNMRSLT